MPCLPSVSAGQALTILILHTGEQFLPPDEQGWLTTPTILADASLIEQLEG